MTGARPTIARLMLAIFIAGFLSAVVHLVSVTHVVLDNGQIAEIDPDSGIPVPENQDGNPLDEGCPYVAELTSINTLISADVVVSLLVTTVDESCENQAGEYFTPLRDVFFLSPSNSPPHIG